MRVILYILILASSIFIGDFITSRSLINKYKMYGIFGKPGSGKSTYLTKIAYQQSKRGWQVYTDDNSCKIPEVKHFDSMNFKAGKWLPDGRKGQLWVDGTINKENRDIVLIFDEIGSLYNNRDFKNNLTPETLKWWKEHRHKRVKIYYGSQSYKDMDLKIRQLSDQLFIIKRGVLKNFSVAKPIYINFDIVNNENSDNSGGQIVEQYKYDLPIFWKFILLKKWIKKFDSYR